jgi:hypothetical protein
MTKLCIDTNIFINFYQKTGFTKKIFSQIMEITSEIVFPEQIINEFKRNRVKVLNGLINGMEGKFKDEVPIYPKTILLQSFEKRNELHKKFEDLKGIHIETINYFKQLIKNPNDDIIYKFVSEIYNHTNTTRIPLNPDIIKSAQIRNFLGNPPYSDGNSKGDEIIFESLLSSCSEDLIIVTNDNRGFKLHEQYLIEEYNSKKGATLTVLNDLSSAIETLGKESTREIQKFDHAKIVYPFGVASPSGSEFPTEGVSIRFPNIGGGCINISPASFSNDGSVSFLNNCRPGKESEYP